MEALSRLFQRNRDLLAGPGPMLWVNPPADLPWAPAGCESDAECFTQDEGVRRQLHARGVPVRFGALPPDRVLARVVLALPREKARLRWLVHALATRLEPDGVLFLGGELRAGGKSATKELAPWFEHVSKRDSARHCVLYEAKKPCPETPFDSRTYRQSWALETTTTPLEVISYPGVFAHGELDAGTALLLRTLDAMTSLRPASVLDVGCGAGVIGAVLARRFPGLNLTLADSNAVALQAARETLEANGLGGRVLPTDGLQGVDGQYDLVISNPPFHSGHRERKDLGRGLFEGVGNFLAPGGQFIMVANRHLPWRRWMDEQAGEHEVLAQNKAYHVLAFRPSARDRSPGRHSRRGGY